MNALVSPEVLAQIGVPANDVEGLTTADLLCVVAELSDRLRTATGELPAALAGLPEGKHHIRDLADEIGRCGPALLRAAEGYVRAVAPVSEVKG